MNSLKRANWFFLYQLESFIQFLINTVNISPLAGISPYWINNISHCQGLFRNVLLVKRQSSENSNEQIDLIALLTQASIMQRAL